MIHEDWLTIYGEYLLPHQKNAKFEKRPENFGKGNIYVSRCEFNECTTSNSNGGAILISSSSSTKFLLEKSSFFCCKTINSGSGGAAYFGNDGNCTFVAVCGFNCSSASAQGFSFIRCTNNVNYKNYMKDSSVSFCSNALEDAAEIIVLYFGDDSMSRVNASYNRCGYNAGCWLYPSISSNECPITCSLSLCSFFNNTAHKSRIVSLSREYSSKHFVYCNVVNNMQNDPGSYGIIYIEGNIEIKDSCILENKAPYTFCESLSSFVITVTNCTLEADVESKRNGNVEIKNIASGSYTLALSHISTGKCEAAIPLNYMKRSTFYMMKKRKTHEEILRLLTLVLISFMPSEEEEQFYYNI